MQEGTQAGDEPGNRGAPERVGLLDGGAAYLTTDFRLFRTCLLWRLRVPGIVAGHRNRQDGGMAKARPGRADFPNTHTKRTAQERQEKPDMRSEDATSRIIALDAHTT